MLSAADHDETASLHEIHASFPACRKHVQTETAMGHLIATCAREAALVVAGDGVTMRHRPPLSALICCIDPLGQDKEGLETTREQVRPIIATHRPDRVDAQAEIESARIVAAADREIKVA